jgi:hypothetical protein
VSYLVSIAPPNLVRLSLPGDPVVGYPLEAASHVALREARLFLQSDKVVSDVCFSVRQADRLFGLQVDRVIFVAFKPEEADMYRRLVPLYFPPEGA